MHVKKYIEWGNNMDDEYYNTQNIYIVKPNLEKNIYQVKQHSPWPFISLSEW